MVKRWTLAPVIEGSIPSSLAILMTYGQLTRSEVPFWRVPMHEHIILSGTWIIRLQRMSNFDLYELVVNFCDQTGSAIAAEGFQGYVFYCLARDKRRQFLISRIDDAIERVKQYYLETYGDPKYSYEFDADPQRRAVIDFVNEHAKKF